MFQGKIIMPELRKPTMNHYQCRKGRWCASSCGLQLNALRVCLSLKSYMPFHRWECFCALMDYSWCEIFIPCQKYFWVGCLLYSLWLFLSLVQNVPYCSDKKKKKIFKIWGKVSYPWTTVTEYTFLAYCTKLPAFLTCGGSRPCHLYTVTAVS